MWLFNRRYHKDVFVASVQRQAGKDGHLENQIVVFWNETKANWDSDWLQNFAPPREYHG